MPSKQCIPQDMRESTPVERISDLAFGPSSQKQESHGFSHGECHDDCVMHRRNLCDMVAEREDRIEHLEAENAKLVDVLHEVETEAVYAYHCLQQDCVTTANSSGHFFKKWWHAECELDRAKAENAKLLELLKEACEMARSFYNLGGTYNDLDDLLCEAAELGVEVSE